MTDVLYCDLLIVYIRQGAFLKRKYYYYNGIYVMINVPTYDYACIYL